MQDKHTMALNAIDGRLDETAKRVADQLAQVRGKLNSGNVDDIVRAGHLLAGLERLMHDVMDEAGGAAG